MENKAKIKHALAVALEVGIVMTLLLLNVSMGYFTKNARNETTIIQKLEQVLTIQNIVLALIGGVASYFVLKLVSKLNHPNQ
jgi:hypothetical protein